MPLTTQSNPKNTGVSITVMADPATDPVLRNEAIRLAEALSLPFADDTPAVRGLWLTRTAQRLEIRQADDGRNQRSRPVSVELSHLDVSSSTGRSRRQPIAKAVFGSGVKGRPVRVADATAGFGGDAWLLASLGCQVTAIERCGVVAALLADGLGRASRVNAETAERIGLIVDDATVALSRVRPAPDVVYLDTMFPPKRKRALERKPMRLLRQIVGSDHDAGELLAVAQRTALKRVVVKRPQHAQPLAGRPTVSFRGKSLRYDVYSTKSIDPTPD